MITTAPAVWAEPRPPLSPGSHGRPAPSPYAELA
jgi:hypothetical protein